MITAAVLSLILATADPLADGFRNPPNSAKPHTWWHWMDGNVTKEGLTADLEAMKQVGIGGAQMFTVAQGIPKGPVDYNSQQWRDMVAHAVKEASRLGIELCIHNCAGWSSSGGPWVTPENAMQVLAWSEMSAFGPKTFSGPLPQPKAPATYASVPYYRDIAVFAFKKQADTDSGRREREFLGKTGVHRWDGLQPDLGKTLASIPTGEIVDLTSKLDKEGNLTWDVPDGEWTVLRMGHVPTGKDNHPAPPEGDGLEVDKLSRTAMDAFWDGMMAKVIKQVGPLAGKTLNNALIDSYEVGSQNWTPKFRAEFRARRGYDPMPYLPTIAGYIVNSKDDTERFQWDYRRTIADLYADNYFRYFGELCHKEGMLFSTEPYGNGGFDNIQVGGTADIPMGEFWVGGGTLETTKLAASVGHIYGRKFIGAESFTADDVRGRWLEEPFAAKALGDLVFTNGVNRYIFHRYAHQPWMNLKPGMTMGPWGTHLERTQTWWTEASAWMKYIARCQYLLQSGSFVADAVYFTGEGAPTDLPYGPALKPRLPAGYDYDGCDTSALMRATVVDGKLRFASGATYRVLLLPESTFMTPAVAQKVASLVRSGLIVVGPKPERSPSLSGQPAADQRVMAIADEVWGATPLEKGHRAVGSGHVFWGEPLDDVFGRIALRPDFGYRSSSGGAKLAFIHRKIGSADVYFVSNQQYQPAEVECNFRITGRAPELWHADTGRMESAVAFANDGRATTVPLRLEPAESVFVVFRRPEPKTHWKSVRLQGSKVTQYKAPKIEIVKARYETADGRGTDVTGAVAQMVKDGQVEIPATNAAFGDPVVNVVKRLVIEFKLDGKVVKKTVDENQTLALVSLPSAPSNPRFAVRNGMLIPYSAGRYVATGVGSKTAVIDVKRGAQSVGITGPWKVNFTPGWGAPNSITLPRLMSWTAHENKGVRYFSGSANYVKEFTMPDNLVEAGKEITLDLGTVKNFATVRLNGKNLGILWKAPFAVDISGAVKAGVNRLEVKITNLWVNRIIGDEQLPPDVEWTGVTLKGWPEWLAKGQPRPKTGRFTFTTWKFWNKDSKLLDSGLLGPVRVRSATPVAIR